jgi:2,3-bisphosphoglycerate-independent phosphoglycerate mutase
MKQVPVLHPPVLLLVLDGFGYRAASDYNAIALAHKPNWDRLWRDYPHTLIATAGLRVGLPEGQMGNSEVGHLNIGAGRIVYQELTRIDLAIQDGSFFKNPALLQAVQSAKAQNGTLHIMGLLSPGGVHSHENHIEAMLALAVQNGLTKICIHAFLDGRDTPPRSAAASLAAMQPKCEHLGAGRIATLCGRFYAMDRDNRWERVAVAYSLLTAGRAEYHAASAVEGLQQAYARDESDEFVKPTVIGTPTAMQDGDAVVFMNFRADRAREITRALTEPAFNQFARERVVKLSAFVTLTSYGQDIALPVAFEPSNVENGFGEYLASLGMKQLRIAETEKYAHVTYFFSGGREAPYAGEDRILVPSPKVATYDLQPEMSASEVTDKLVAAIQSGKYQAIICNYANGDMVGHTGVMAAAVKAVETLDTCIGHVVEAMQAAGGEVLITADHGNAEQMLDPETGQPHTAHTMNAVPFLYVGRKARMIEGGALQDVAPTLLAMMGLPQPPEMGGRALIEWL